MIRIVEADRLEWDYNVPKNITFEYTDAPNCIICFNDKLREWLSPFLVANVPAEKLTPILEKYFGVLLNIDAINEHRNHIVAKYQADDSIRESAEEQIKRIESDLPTKIDEDAALESTLRGLMARKLQLEKLKEYGQEYVKLAQQITKIVELKKKIKKELPTDLNITLKDLIKVDTEQFGPSSESGELPIQRDGTKENIESLVRGQPKFTKR